MRKRETLRAGWMVTVMALTATPAFARSVELKEAGVALWVFVAIGAVIVLLQVIPAAILLFSFIGTTISAVFKREGVSPEEAVISVAEPVAMKR